MGVGPCRNGPKNMFGETLAVTRTQQQHRHPVRWHRTRVPWFDHIQWNLDHFGSL
jgi:hypothetical protein